VYAKGDLGVRLWRSVAEVDADRGPRHNGVVTSPDPRGQERPFVREHEERTFERLDSTEIFDRMAFAERVLRFLRPLSATVVLYERHSGVHVERGGNQVRGLTRSYALVGISPRASRSHIALALAEVAGVARQPFVVDLLVQVGATT
jgi:hypothetical protein